MKISRIWLAALLLLSLSFAACGSKDQDSSEDQNEDNGHVEDSITDDPKDPNEGVTTPLESGVAGYAVYQAPNQAYTIAYPQDWMVTGASDFSTFLSRDGTGAVFIVSSSSIGNFGDQDAIFDQLIANTKERYPDVTEQERGEITVDGYTGVFIKYSSSSSTFSWTQWFIPSNDKNYILTFTEILGSKSHLEEAETMVDSLKFGE